MLKDVLLFLVGTLVGGMNAIAGGGMLIGFPVLLAAGMPALNANITSNIIAFPGQLASAYGYRKYLRQVPLTYLWLLVPCAAGAALGALLLRHTSSRSFQSIVPGLILFAVVLFAFQPLIHFHLHSHMRSRAKNNRTLALIGLAFLPLSIYGGYFGIGFGFVILAFLGYTSLHDVHKMNALKNLAAAAISIVSLSLLLTTHLVNWHYGLVMAAGNIVGGYSGASLAVKVSSHTVRIVVIAIGLTAASYLAVRTY
ncbi:MAG: sulfite exporter TauE/SafE family protein [Candidatus Saccharibacteria bacterium]